MSGPADSTASLPLRPKREASLLEGSTKDDDTAEIRSEIRSEIDPLVTEGVPVSEEADPPRPNKRRRPIEGELAGLEQEAEEESSRAAETKMRADAYLPKRKGVSSKKKELKVISKNWTPGWLEYIDESIRPLAVSRNLVMHLLVMSTWMSLGDARQALLKGAKGLRPFGPAEVRDATEKFLGRGWSELKSEALEKLR